MGGNINEMINRFSVPKKPAPVVNIPKKLPKMAQPKKAPRLQSLQYTRTFQDINVYLRDAKIKSVKVVPMLDQAARARLHNRSSLQDKKVEVLMYKVLRFSAQFEQAWKTSGKATWHFSLYAVAGTFFNELREEVQKIEMNGGFPVTDMNDRRYTDGN